MVRWVLKPVALAKACKVLGLQHPVSVKPILYTWSAGEYQTEPAHSIRIHQTLSAHDNSPTFTIWHELGHAYQFENYVDCDIDRWDALQGLYDSVLDPLTGIPLDKGPEWNQAYDEIPLEKDANEIAYRYYEQYPLVRLVRQRA